MPSLHLLVNVYIYMYIYIGLHRIDYLPLRHLHGKCESLHLHCVWLDFWLTDMAIKLYIFKHHAQPEKSKKSPVRLTFNPSSINVFLLKINVLYYRSTAYTNDSMIPYSITLCCFIMRETASGWPLAEKLRAQNIVVMFSLLALRAI